MHEASLSSDPLAEPVLAQQSQQSAELSLRAVLWDMDGTLVDSEPYWIAAEMELVRSHGGSWSHEQALGLVGQSLWRSSGMLQDAGVKLSRREIIDAMTAQVIARVREEMPWRPGARELVTQLRENGIRCALVTMSEGPLASEIRNALPVGSFEFMVTGDQVTEGKPHPEPYLRALELLRRDDPELEARQCLALEDSIPGVASALAAGLPTIGIPHAVPLPDDERRVTWDSLEGRSLTDLSAALWTLTGRELATSGAQLQSGEGRPA